MQTIRPINEDDHRRLSAHASNQHLELFLVLLWETGGRPKDIWALTAESIDYVKREIAYIPGKSAGFNSEPVRIPVSRNLEVRLRGLPDSAPLFPGMDFHWVVREFVALKKRCHLPPWVPESR